MEDLEEIRKQLESIDAKQKSVPAEKPLNLKTDIVEATPVEDAFFVLELKGKDGKTRAYYKRVEEKEIKRMKLFDRIFKHNNMSNKYSLLEIEYPRILSTSLSRLSNQIIKKIESIFYGEIHTPNSIIMSSVNTSGYAIFREDSHALVALKYKPITNEEWQQVVNFIKDLNSQDFYHTDLENNLFFRRDENGKLIVTIIDFDDIYNFYNEFYRHIDISNLEVIRIHLESIGAKEKSIPETTNNSFLSNLKNWVLPVVSVGVAAYSALKGFGDANTGVLGDVIGGMGNNFLNFSQRGF